ncbi:MAG: hypothetical protein AB7H88_15805 [Vicinamibacterales bacterium]
MSGTVRETSLHRSPFWILRASSRDNRQVIVERADQRSLEMDHDVCQRARSELTNPRTRLAAELSWLPGLSPKKAEQLAARILSEPMAVEPGIPALAHLNLMVAAFETLDGGVPASDVARFIQEIASESEEMVVAHVRRDINEDRAVSGFPELTSDGPIDEGLSNRKRQILDAIRGTLDRLPTDHIVSALTQTVEAATGGGEYHAPELVDELVDAYEVEAHQFLHKEGENISRLVEAASAVAAVDKRSAGELVARIDQVARNWDRVAQPIQVSAKARGTAHVQSNELAFQIRDLAVDLFNQHDMVAESKRLTELLGAVFAEVPLIAERAEQDADAIAEVMGNREEWSREITYQAEIGVAFKNTLSISPAGISWKGQTFPLADITRVRWGGVKHSVNGIPTGTTYTIAFGDERSEAVVELRREEVYSNFLEKLWRAVCARLVVELVTALRAGQTLNFGDAVVKDDSVTLKRHKWMGSDERVRCSWQELHIWSAEGSFCIGAQNDKKVYAALSYIHVPNAHILEQAIRIGFKRGINRLSDILQDD